MWGNFSRKRQNRKKRENYPHAKISTFTVNPNRLFYFSLLLTLSDSKSIGGFSSGGGGGGGVGSLGGGGGGVGSLGGSGTGSGAFGSGDSSFFFPLAGLPFGLAAGLAGGAAGCFFGGDGSFLGFGLPDI